MNNRIMMHTSLAAGLAMGVAIVLAPAAARDAAPGTISEGEMVLELGGPGGGAGTGKVSLQDFSFGPVTPRPKKSNARAAGAPPASACPSSSESSRWKAPELNSSKADGGLPPGQGCLNVKSPRDAASGLATGRRSKGWDGCVKGTHIASAHIIHRDLAYRFTDLTVEECSAEGMVLSFSSATAASSSVQPPAASATISGSN